MNDIPKEFNEYPGVNCGICDQSFDYWDGYDTTNPMCEECSAKEKHHFEKLGIEKPRIEAIISKLENEAAIPKRNPNYSMLELLGEPAIKISINNDDSGELLICETFTKQTALDIFKYFRAKYF